jgi:hypothetical protein
MKRKIVEGITVQRVRPERCIYEQCSDIKRYRKLLLILIDNNREVEKWKQKN